MIYISLLHHLLFLTLNSVLNCYTKSSLTVNIINHIALSYYSLNVLLEIESGEKEYLPKAILCGQWLMSYMIYDLCVMWFLTKTRSVIYTIHHVSAIVLIKLMIESGRFNDYYPVICLFEMSSIPLNIRYLCRQYNVPKDKWFMKVNDVLFVITFIVIRMIIGGSYVASAWIMLNNDFFVDKFIRVIIILFGVLHFFWLYQIIKKISKPKCSKKNT